MDTDKLCKDCNTLKPLSEYYQLGYGVRQQITSRCKPCYNAWQLDLRERKGKIGYDPAAVKDRCHSLLLRYGLTREQVQRFTERCIKDDLYAKFAHI